MIGVPAEVALVDSALSDRGSAERASGANAYLKLDLEFHGVDASGVRAAAAEVLHRHPELDHDGFVALVHALWEGSSYDRRAVGVALLERRPDVLGSEDLELVETLLRRSGTWALVDWLSTKVAAPIVSRHPDTKAVLRRWSTDEDFWLRRSAMLSLLPDLRAGGGDFELFAGFASAMIKEKEFFIRKAIGWILRDTSKKRPDIVSNFLSDHIDTVSGLTLREGSKYLPVEQRDELLQRYRDR